MRDIKFRAWCHQDKRMYELSLPFYTEAAGGILMICKEKPSPALEDMSIPTLLQYTGLKDKNGKEIYEGDRCIHHWHRETGTIEWSQKLCCFQWRYDDQVTDGLLAVDAEHFEVIGNIYENPELIINGTA